MWQHKSLQMNFSMGSAVLQVLLFTALIYLASGAHIVRRSASEDMEVRGAGYGSGGGGGFGGGFGGGGGSSESEDGSEGNDDDDSSGGGDECKSAKHIKLLRSIEDKEYEAQPVPRSTWVPSSFMMRRAEPKKRYYYYYYYGDDAGDNPYGTSHDADLHQEISHILTLYPWIASRRMLVKVEPLPTEGSDLQWRTPLIRTTRDLVKRADEEEEGDSSMESESSETTMAEAGQEGAEAEAGSSESEVMGAGEEGEEVGEEMNEDEEREDEEVEEEMEQGEENAEEMSEESGEGAETQEESEDGAEPEEGGEEETVNETMDSERMARGINVRLGMDEMNTRSAETSLKSPLNLDLGDPLISLDKLTVG